VKQVVVETGQLAASAAPLAPFSERRQDAVNRHRCRFSARLPVAVPHIEVEQGGAAATFVAWG
jgi:hypothetical protein